MNSRPFLLLAAALWIAAAGVLPDPSSAQDALAASPTHPRAEHLALHWAVDTNRLADSGRFRATLTLRNGGAVPLRGEGWTVYFNFVRQIDPESVTAPVNITRVNGNFYKMTPGAEFSPLAPGTALSISYEAPFSAIKRIDAPAGFYVVFAGPGGEPEPPAVIADVTIEPFRRPEQRTRGAGDEWPVPTPARRYRHNCPHSLPMRWGGWCPRRGRRSGAMALFRFPRMPPSATRTASRPKRASLRRGWLRSWDDGPRS